MSGYKDGIGYAHTRYKGELVRRDDARHLIHKRLDALEHYAFHQFTKAAEEADTTIVI
jgi:hypothetical protein